MSICDLNSLRDNLVIINLCAIYCFEHIRSTLLNEPGTTFFSLSLLLINYSVSFERRREIERYYPPRAFLHQFNFEEPEQGQYLNALAYKEGDWSRKRFFDSHQWQSKPERIISFLWTQSKIKCCFNTTLSIPVLSAVVDIKHNSDYQTKQQKKAERARLGGARSVWNRHTRFMTFAFGFIRSAEAAAVRSLCSIVLDFKVFRDVVSYCVGWNKKREANFRRKKKRKRTKADIRMQMNELKKRLTGGGLSW